MNASPTIKTQWKNAAIPREVHEQAKMVAASEQRPMGEIIAEIIEPVLRQRLGEALRTRGVKFKRQTASRNGGGKRR